MSKYDQTPAEVIRIGRHDISLKSVDPRYLNGGASEYLKFDLQLIVRRRSRWNGDMGLQRLPFERVVQCEYVNT